jgi:NADPH-dependent curcumin reductase CurA
MPSYTSIHLAERPKDAIIAGKTFTAKQQPVPSAASLEDGEVLFQTLYLSLDPAMRGWLNPTRSYIPPVDIGAVMRGSGIGLIVASRSKQFPVGSYASGMCGWSEYTVLKEKFVEPLDLPSGAVPTDALGCLGMTGLTAYFGILDVGAVKAGDFVVVSGAAGATGSVVGQIAKIKGARVLGLAGEDSKVAWLKEELGFDDALNYKDPQFKDKFRAATKGLIDVYFDNVGGEILDMALARAKPHARFVMCGAISEYNKKKAQGPSVCARFCSPKENMLTAAELPHDHFDAHPHAGLRRLRLRTQVFRSTQGAGAVAVRGQAQAERNNSKGRHLQSGGSAGGPFRGQEYR